MWLREKKLTLKSLIGFVSASKIDNYNGRAGGGGEKIPKESTEQVKKQE